MQDETYRGRNKIFIRVTIRMISLANKVALVTGAGQGIGLEICKKLASAGAKLILNDIDEAFADKAANEITNEGGVCIPTAGNAGSVEVIEHMVETAVASFGHLDIAIANAGITLFGDFFSYTPDSFFKVMELNLGGTFFLAQ